MLAETEGWEFLPSCLPLAPDGTILAHKSGVEFRFRPPDFL